MPITDQLTLEQLAAENAELRARLDEAEETLRAIREGEVDAVIVSGSKGDRVFALSETENLHQLMVEAMNEAGLATTPDGLLVFCNARAASLFGRPKDEFIGRNLLEFVAPPYTNRFRELLQAARYTTADARIAFFDAASVSVPMHIWASFVDRPESPLICLVATDLRRIESDRDLIAQLQEQQQQLRLSQVAALNLMQDAVTARQAAERTTVALEASEQRTQQALRVGHSFTFEWHPATDQVVRSASCETILRLTGGAASNDTGQGYFERIHPDDRARFLQTIGKLTPEADTYTEEYRVRCPDGRVVVLDETGRAIFDDAGKLERLVGVASDITARKLAEEALRESEGRFRMLASHAPVGIFMSNQRGEALYVNDNWCALAGLSVEEAQGMGWLKALHPEDRERIAAGWEHAVEKSESSTEEFRFLRSDGSEVWVLGNATKLRDVSGQHTGYVGTVADITARKLAEETLVNARDRLELEVRRRTLQLTVANTALVASETKFRGLVESAPDATVIVGRDGLILLINAQTERLFGYARVELIWKPVEMLLPERFRKRHPGQPGVFFTDPNAQLMGRGLELFGQRKDGSEFPVEISLSPLATTEGTLVCSSIRDISERKAAEKALRESEARLQAILDNSPAMIFLKDTTGRYLLFNHEFERVFQLSLSAAVGRTDAELFSPEMAEAFRANDLQVIETGQPMLFDELTQLADGPHTSIVTKFPLRDLDGKIYAIGGIATDITERKRLEAEVLRISEREQQRIARDLHDGLGQQLAGISCMSSVLRSKLGPGNSPEALAASRISKLLSAAVSLTRSLAHGLAGVPDEPLGLPHALGELAANVSNMFQVNCVFKGAELTPVLERTTATHLYRIAQEAITNAIRHGRAQRIEIELLQKPKHVTLGISNDGANLKEQPGGSDGLGQRIMNYRAQVIGGTLVVRNKAGGKGVEVICAIPTSNETKQPPSHGQTSTKAKSTEKNLPR